MKCRIENGTLVISLPITTPTGKVRVKRTVAGQAADPVACRSTPIQTGDYLEWQISYDTDDLAEPSALRDLPLQKPQGIRYACELAWLIRNSHNIGLISDRQLDDLKQFVATPLDQGIEESEKIERQEDTEAETIATLHGFRRHLLLTPNYLFIANNYQIEIKISHKQRAVGNQAMIYVNLPVGSCRSLTGAPLIGRCAERNEQVEYLINADNVSLMQNTVMGFALASQAHRQDLRLILAGL